VLICWKNGLIMKVEMIMFLAGPAVIGPNSPTLPSSAPTPLSPQGKYNTSK
jgi:hypothetical protein